MLLVAACSTEETAPNGPLATTAVSSVTTTAVPTTIPTTTTLDRGDLSEWELISVSLDEETLLVARANSPDERAQGLMGVEDLGAVDGMLFVFPADTNGSFWMKDTLIALDIAFFSADGVLVDILAMEPCLADPCPSYRPDGVYRWALELPAGGLTGLSDQARLTFP